MGSLACQILLIAMPHLAVNIPIPFDLFFTDSLRLSKTIYPAFIILMVFMEKSQEEMKMANEMSLSQSIRFASVIAASQASRSLEEAATMIHS
jgi:hypothetical protein